MSKDKDRAVTPPWAKIQGRCPACNAYSLFLGDGGYVTCAMLRCPNPCAPSEALGVELDGQAA